MCILNSTVLMDTYVPGPVKSWTDSLKSTLKIITYLTDQKFLLNWERRHCIPISLGLSWRSRATRTMPGCISAPTFFAPWICCKCLEASNCGGDAAVTEIGGWSGCRYVIHGDGGICWTILERTHSPGCRTRNELGMQTPCFTNFSVSRFCDLWWRMRKS